MWATVKKEKKVIGGKEKMGKRRRCEGALGEEGLEKALPRILVLVFRL